MTWAHELRQRFPALQSHCYLNSASAGPLTREVARAGAEVYEGLLAGGDGNWRQWAQDSERAREALARLAGCRPQELAFTRSTSHSQTIVAQMLWDAGKRSVVALADEFPASTIPFLNRGFDVRFVSAGEDGLYSFETIAEALEGRDVLVASHVMYGTGVVVDPVRMGEIARKAGTLFVLCSTQSLGALRVDFAGCGADFLTGTSHKWMCGGFGAGYLVMRSELMGQLPWPVAGWLSNKDAMLMRNDRLDLLEDARVLELGCTPFPNILAMGAAARLWLETGPERVEARIRELTRGFRERLRGAGFHAPELESDLLSGITVLPHPSPRELSVRLNEEGVAVTPRGAGIRFSLHAFNDESDLERAVDLLSRLAR